MVVTPRLTAIDTLSSPSSRAFTEVVTKASKATPDSFAAGSFKVGSGDVRKGETQMDRYTRLLKGELHHDYPITGEEGYTLTPLASTASVDDIKNTLHGSWLDPDQTSDDNLGGLADALEACLKGGLEVVTGSGSGNNTLADIVGVYDPKHQQLGYLMASNFGSDD